ncbi:hypothetical protein HPB47_002797 [Ixodes persulcatus]|uniref:Uncharacterized protein n=1 Tax=Ixodes persulcatus TaxID=34615 RepID=A0AC60PLV7_IXOPE|nr:hypothetical protein HPB47_002797 [Ixodes persulcatus]
MACFRLNVPLVTLYATLGEDGIIRALQDTEDDSRWWALDLLHLRWIRTRSSGRASIAVLWEAMVLRRLLVLPHSRTWTIRVSGESVANSRWLRQIGELGRRRLSRHRQTTS